MEQNTPSATYDSNPFTSTWTGIKKMWELNQGSAVGVTLFYVLLFAIIGVTALAMFFATVAFAIQQGANADLTNTSFGNLSFFSYSSIYGTWLIGAALIIVAFTLVQVLQLQLSIASARSKAVKFGALFKSMWRYILPLLGLVGLAIATVVAALLVLALLAPVVGPITIVVALVATLAGVYAAFRLTYTSYLIVDKQQGPLQAIKGSWKLSDGHIIETLGAGCVSSLVVMVPGVVLAALTKATEGTPGAGGIFSILELLASVLLILFSAMAFAERYVQLSEVADKRLKPAPLSPMNYLAIVLFIAVGGLYSALSPQQTIVTPTDMPGTAQSSPQGTDLPTNFN